MRITLKLNKSVHENAAAYYEKAKDTKKRIAGLEKAIEDTKKELEGAIKKQEEKKKQVKVKKEKKWYEKFHWFYTSGGRLAVGGRNAQQNDMVFARHMEDNDLFFHADIQGASAVVLKEGADAGEDELLEVAQFAACFSNAWKNGNAAVDVYAVRKEQISKKSGAGYIATGAFAITGERKWFRSTKLELKVGLEVISDTSEVLILPTVSKKKLTNELLLLPSTSGKEKGALAKGIAKRLSVHVDEIMQILPNGRSKIR